MRERKSPAQVELDEDIGSYAASMCDGLPDILGDTDVLDRVLPFSFNVTGILRRGFG